MALDKKQLHHQLRRFRHLRTWWLIVALVVFATSSAFLLRQNNLGMVSRRQAVVSADKNSGDVDKALKNLRRYMMRHMNTTMSQPVQLSGSYNREVQRRVDAAAAAGKANDAEAYQRAQNECKTSNTVTYAQCVIDKTAAITPGSNPVLQVVNPPVELYSYQFYSPLWSPDLAGFSVLLFVLILLTLICKIVGEQVATRILKRHL
jgi:hypothetical protein